MKKWKEVLRGHSPIERRFLFFEITKGEIEVDPELMDLVKTALKVSSEKDKRIYDCAVGAVDITDFVMKSSDRCAIHLSKAPLETANVIERIMQKAGKLIG